MLATSKLAFALCAVILIVESARAASEAPLAPEGLMDAFAQAQRASANEDWQAMRDALTAAESFAPSHPAVLFHLARAEALVGNDTNALRRLRQLVVAGGTNRDLAADKAFGTLREHEDFKALARELHEVALPLARGHVAFELADTDLVVEGIAYDERRDAFFIGSLSSGEILLVRRDGSHEPFIEEAAGATEDRRGQVLGLRVDSQRKLLWAATLVIDTAAPAFRRGPGGWASLRAFDLSTGELTATYSPKDSSSPHLLNDIAVAPNGDVYVTDSEGNALLRLQYGSDKLARIYGDSQRFGYPNGVVVDADRDRLYVAHLEGISIFSLSAREPISPAFLKASAPTTGIDGLYLCGRALLGVQSLLDAQQVVQFSLDSSGFSVVTTKVLERGHPAHGVATTGAIAEDAFYYIGASQLERLRPDGTVTPAKSDAGTSVVLRLPLPQSCNQ